MLAFARSARNVGSGPPDGEEPFLHGVLGELARRAARGARARTRCARRGRRARRARPRRLGRRARPGPRQRGGCAAFAWRGVPATRATLTRWPREPPWPCFAECARFGSRLRRAVEPASRAGTNKCRSRPRHQRGVEDAQGHHRGRAVGLLAAAAVVGAATARSWGRRRVESPRGATHRGGPVSRPHGPVRVPEPGQAEHRDDSRQRHSGRGSGGRPELVHVLAERALQPEARHQRRRARRTSRTGSSSARRPARSSSATPPSRSR